MIFLLFFLGGATSNRLKKVEQGVILSRTFHAARPALC